MAAPKAKGKLLLVDGNSLLYRSFFAIPRLTNRQGLPTNAVYGLATVLRKILSEEAPDYTAVVFDAAGKTFRHELYASYKANRPETPDDLTAQFPNARKLCKVLGLPTLEIPGVEADDVIGTLASRARGAGYQVFMVSSDKDLLQLVSEGVSVIHPGRYELYDPESVRERFGVEPENVVDVLALMGDSTDNVPGVPGIGEKGAVRLIQKWGSVESCLEHVDEIANKRQREALRQHAEQARLSKQLVRIARDVSLDVDLETLRYRGAEQAEAFRFFEELGFTSLLRDYLSEAPSPGGLTHAPVGSAADVARLADKARSQGRLSICLALAERADEDSPLAALGLAVEPREGFFLSMSGEGAKLFEKLKPLLSDDALPKVGHDLKRDWAILARRGVELKPIGFDTMIASYVLHPGKRSHGLDTLALELLQRKLADGAEPAPGQQALPGLGGVPSEGQMKSAAERAAVVLQLQQRLEQRIEQEDLGAVLRDIELPLVRVLAEMEQVGIRVNVEQLRAMSVELGLELERLTREIYELAGVEFNINSPKQLGEILFDKMNLPSFRKTQKQRVASTRMDVLEELATHFELPRKVLDYRSLSKLKGTYVDALPALVRPETGRIHTSFNQTVAATGRLSSSEPNLQNIPIRTELGRRIRSAFVADPGWQLLSADYSQIELRVLAHLSEDPSLVEAFECGEDIHRRTAQRVFGEDTDLPEAEQRRRAKIINFSVIYGKSAYTLAKDLSVSTREAQAFIDAYFDRHPKVREVLEKIIKEARLTGKVKTLFGRHRYIPEIGSRNRNTRQAAERVAVNAPIQGTAADLIKKAMVELWRELKQRRRRSRLLLQVHDELVLEVPEEEIEEASTLVRQVMEGVYPLKVPLKVDLSAGPSWLH